MTIIGLPIAFMVFNRIPALMTLRARTVIYETEVRDGVSYVCGRNPNQLPILLRAIWFVLIGWWLGFIWMYAAWFISLLIVTLPIGICDDEPRRWRDDAAPLLVLGSMVLVTDIAFSAIMPSSATDWRAYG